jgi:hypothetical protein
MGSGEKQEISLGTDFDAVVRYGGTTVELSADGNVTVRTMGNAVVYTNGDVMVRPAANDVGPSAASEPKPGDKMADGTVFAGISPDTNKPMYATPGDVPLTMKWKQAMYYAFDLDAHGHKDWRVPTKGELNVLFKNRAAIGGFDESGLYPGGWYWSSSQTIYAGYAWDQRFSDGYRKYGGKDIDLSLRLVR